MRIVALDPGRTVGWAGPGRLSGARAFTNADHAYALLEFSRWFDGLLGQMRPDLLVLERGFGGNRASGRLTSTIEAHAHMLAARRGIQRTDRSASTVRKWLLGYASISRKDIPVAAQRDREIDRRILAAVRVLGFSPPDEHGADACALLAFVENERISA